MLHATLHLSPPSCHSPPFLPHSLLHSGTPGADAAGPYLPVTVTFSDTELCLLNGHYGAGCQFQCPGGAMDVCNGKAACSTGVSGAGTCACSNMGMSCAFDDACDKSYGNSPLHTVGSQEKLLYSFSDQAPYHKSLGPAADFEVSRPAHIKGITIWGRAGMTWTSTGMVLVLSVDPLASAHYSLRACPLSSPWAHTLSPKECQSRGLPDTCPSFQCCKTKQHCSLRVLQIFTAHGCLLWSR